MKTLFEIYNNIFSDNSKWKYYSKMEINPFISDYDTKHFITNFIELSGKSEQNPLYENINKLEDQRIRHIVSTFFLGTYFYFNIKVIKDSIDIVVNRFKKQNPDSNINFSFIWFIICLFHDLGYSIENKDRYTNFDEFIKGKVKYYLKKRVGVPALYENVYKDYFNYRLNSSNDCIRKPDHGICGGIILFNKLNEILISKQKKNKSKGLSWNPKLVNIYRLACWVILSHNIFYVRKGDMNEQVYRDSNLKDLILEEIENSKINLKKHVFLFLFAMVDSIDPIKTFESYENLKKIKCETYSDKIIFELDDNKFKHDYFNKICELKKWLIPSITVDNNSIEIDLNNTKQ